MEETEAKQRPRSPGAFLQLVAVMFVEMWYRKGENNEHVWNVLKPSCHFL